MGFTTHRIFYARIVLLIFCTEFITLKCFLCIHILYYWFLELICRKCKIKFGSKPPERFVEVEGSEMYMRIVFYLHLEAISYYISNQRLRINRSWRVIFVCLSILCLQNTETWKFLLYTTRKCYGKRWNHRKRKKKHCSHILRMVQMTLHTKQSLQLLVCNRCSSFVPFETHTHAHKKSELCVFVTFSYWNGAWFMYLWDSSPLKWNRRYPFPWEYWNGKHMKTKHRPNMLQTV